MAFNGVTSSTKKHIQLDAGALYKNYDPSSDTPASASAKLIGATVGGSTLAIVPEVRQISVDGVKGATKGFEVIDSWTATLTANLKEVSKGSVALSLGAATTTTASGFDKIVPDPDFADADYLDNITWIGKISGSTDPIMIVLKNALCMNGFNFTVADKSEGNVPLVMTAHYDVTDLDSVPIEIYIPTIV